jgi:hypothetical protein
MKFLGTFKTLADTIALESISFGQKLIPVQYDEGTTGNN